MDERRPLVDKVQNIRVDVLAFENGHYGLFGAKIYNEIKYSPTLKSPIQHFDVT